MRKLAIQLTENDIAMQRSQNLQAVYVTPECCVCVKACQDALLSDSDYFTGGGGSYTGDDIVDNGNY